MRITNNGHILFLAKWKSRKTYQNLRKHSEKNATYVYGAMIHSATQESPDYQWYGIKRSIYNFRVWGYHIEAVHDTHLTNLVGRPEKIIFRNNRNEISNKILASIKTNDNWILHNFKVQ